MTIKTQIPNAGHYIKSEVGSISRDKIEFTGGKFMPGEVFGVVGGQAVKLDFAATDGSELAKGVCYAYVDASASAKEQVVTTRLTEVNLNALTLPEGYTTPDLDSVKAELAKSFVIVRG